MCLLLLFVSTNPPKGKFRLILTSNRDEYFTRPAKPAHFWEENKSILGGRDMTPGKEGGTWLAASKSGKIGVLLNVSKIASDAQKEGRGFIVNDYVKSKNSTSHLESLHSNAELYNAFHLVAIDLKDPAVPLKHFCNIEPKITNFGDGVYAFCNSSLSEPYLKAVSGREQLEEIVSQLGKSDCKEELLRSLLNLLRDEKWHYPDPVIDSISAIRADMKGPISAICVRPDNVQYGTRTHSIVLVDNEGNGDFYEWTLNIPLVNNEMKWTETHLKFQVDS